MKLGFAGTPEFARTALLALIESDHQVALVLCQPDRPSGRGMKLQPGAVKLAAADAAIAVLQTPSLRLDGRFPDEASAAHARLAAAELDLLVVAAYGLLLPQSVLDLPRLGCLNIHASLLPRWRGAAPVQRAIEAGDERTGISIMQMDAGLDTGAVLLQQSLAIGPKVSAGLLTAQLAELGAALLLDALSELSAGRAVATPQPDAGASYAKKIAKSEAQLDWSEPATVLERRIRAFDPFPGAAAAKGSNGFKIWSARVADDQSLERAPGTILAVSCEGIAVACGAGTLVLEILQRPGGRRVPALEFVQGGMLQPGSVLQ